MYDIKLDYTSILAGTDNHTSRAYMEADKNISNDTNASMTYMKNFITSIENIASKDSVKDPRLSESKGNVKRFSGYDNIKTAITFLNRNLSGIPAVRDCVTVFNALESYQPLYTEAYDKNCRLVVLEYENSLYMLVTGLSMVMANNMEVVTNGTEIRIQKKQASTMGVIPKTLAELAKQLKTNAHRDYLEQMIKASDNDNVKDIGEETIFESTVSDVLDVIKYAWKGLKALGTKGVSILRSFKQSLFGIIPLIRSIIYLRYKKKADTIASLEEQAVFITENIERLKNKTTMDPAKKESIIKKQQAIALAYMKKAEKLRAQLSETEKAVAKDVNEQDKKLPEPDDDFIIELANYNFDEDVENAYLQEDYSSDHVSQFLERKVYGHGAGARKSFAAVDRVRDERSLFGKKSGKPKESEEDGTVCGMSLKEAKEKVYETLSAVSKKTLLDTITLKIGEMHKDDPISKRTATKFGGIPYWPKSMEYPKPSKKNSNVDDDDYFFYLLAQLNFAELPKLSGYPSSGILQIYLVPDDVFGYENSNFEVVYHKTIAPKSEWVDIDPGQTTMGMKKIAYKSPFYVNGVYYPTGKLEQNELEPVRVLWDDVALPELNKAFNENWKSLIQSPKEIYDFVIQYYKEQDQKHARDDGSRIGGHYYFTQSDPLDDYNEESFKENALLFQMDSEDNIQWGDCGIANFFIKRSDLAKKRFVADDIFYTWDCC